MMSVLKKMARRAWPLFDEYVTLTLPLLYMFSSLT